MQVNRYRPFVAIFIAALCCVLISSPAFAAYGTSANSAFTAAGAKFWKLGEEVILGLGKGVMLLSGAWAVLAWMGRLGHFSTAITVFVGGVFLSVLPTLVNTFF